jgi:hypothetical protein
MKYFSVKTTGVALCAGFTMMMSVGVFSFESNRLSSSWLNNQINKHPDIISANALMSYIFSSAEGSNLRLYNSELVSEYVQEGSANNFSFAINQIIDLWDKQKSEAQYALLEAKENPIIGLSAGKNNRENVVGVNSSMPLNVSHDYFADAKSENQKIISTEASFRATFRKQKFFNRANTYSFISNKHYLERWTKLMRGRGENSAKLLYKEWQVGYLNTSQYLLALQQRAQGLYAGIDLKTQIKLSAVEWLLVSVKLTLLQSN